MGESEDPSPGKGPDSTLFDSVRRKNLKALPEERVRQSMLRWLEEVIEVPPRLIAVEYPLSSLDPACRLRADVVVWKVAGNVAGKGGLTPWLLAECKAPGVKLTDSVADQTRGYAVQIKAEYVLVTNGVEMLCFHLRDGTYQLVSGLPRFSTR